MAKFYRVSTNKYTRTHAHMHTHRHTHTHPFNGPFSGTTQVSRYQKGKTNLDFTEASGSGIPGPYASLHLAPDR